LDFLCVCEKNFGPESKAKIEAHLIKVHGYSEEQASKAASWAIDEFDRRKESKENEIATVQKE
jgi:hypothetical protein